jgi:Fe-S cluster assembly protein SufB
MIDTGHLVTLRAEEPAGQAEPPGRRPEAGDLREAQCAAPRARARLAGAAVDAVFDNVSVATTFKPAGQGGDLLPFSDALRDHPALIERYIGSVMPYTDISSPRWITVFTDGSFVYVPKMPPMELSTYFRINAAKTGQFERTLIIMTKAA